MDSNSCLVPGPSWKLLTHNSELDGLAVDDVVSKADARVSHVESRSSPDARLARTSPAGSGPRPTNTNIVVVGLGYVGLPTAIAFADSGCRVVGYDVSEERLSAIKAGSVDLLSAEREQLRQHLESDTLALTTNPVVLESADAVLVCVPTPVDSHLVPDLSALSAACKTTTRHAVPGQIIVLTSTTYVGCTRHFVVESLTARGLRVGEDVFVAFSPERLDPGNPTRDHRLIPRVIGGVTEACQRRASEILGWITSAPHAVSSPESAEMTKLLENSFRAVNIALVNEFADACGELRLDILEIIEAAATKPYGYMPFYPGPGVGGHCIPCDPHYLLWQLRARRARLPVTETAMTSIATRPRLIFARIREILGESGRAVSGARVLLVGVSYKPGVSDLRGSPALEIMGELLASGAVVEYFDPIVKSLRVDGHELTTVPPTRHQQWDVVVVHTLHPEVDYSWLAQFPVVLDATYRAAEVPNRVLP